jgi:hypothetical protein
MIKFYADVTARRGHMTARLLSFSRHPLHHLFIVCLKWACSRLSARTGARPRRCAFSSCELAQGIVGDHGE